MIGDITEKLGDGPLGEILSELKQLGAEVRSVRGDQARMVDRIASIENRIERQLDTKPIWERALAEISETRNEVQKMAADFRTELREVKRNVRGLNDSMLSVLGQLREVDERLAQLESQIGTHQHT